MAFHVQITVGNPRSALVRPKYPIRCAVSHDVCHTCNQNLTLISNSLVEGLSITPFSSSENFFWTLLLNSSIEVYPCFNAIAGPSLGNIRLYLPRLLEIGNLLERILMTFSLFEPIFTEEVVNRSTLGNNSSQLILMRVSQSDGIIPTSTQAPYHHVAHVKPVS